MTSMPRSLVLSGGGRYADPWHPFAKTSARLADVLWSLGHRVEVTDFVADRVADTLGHGVESYESAGHRRLLTRAVQWLTEGVS
jgi:hypothetical protein